MDCITSAPFQDCASCNYMHKGNHLNHVDFWKVIYKCYLVMKDWGIMANQVALDNFIAELNGKEEERES